MRVCGYKHAELCDDDPQRCPLCVAEELIADLRMRIRAFEAFIALQKTYQEINNEPC